MKLKKCKRCKDKTEDYIKINNIKIALCSETCEIEYILRRFLKTRYTYHTSRGELSK